MRKKGSIFNRLDLRIALLYSGLLSLLVIGISIYVSSYVRTLFIDSTKSQLLSEARLIATQVGNLTGEKSMEPLIENLIRSYSRMLNVRITVIHADGEVVVETSSNPENMENHNNRPEILSALKGEESTSIRYSSTLNQEMLYAAIPVKYGEMVISVIRLSVPLTLLSERSMELVQTMIWVVIIAILFSSALAFAIAQRTMLPLRRLTENVYRVSSGEEEEIILSDRNDEVGLLNQAFRELSTQLKERIGELQKERGTLQAVLTNMTDGIIIVDRNGIVVLINPAAMSMFGVTGDQSIGKSLIEVLRTHQLVELWKKSNLSCKTEITTLETTPDRIFIQAIVTSLGKDMNGLSLLIIQDLTRVKKLEIVRRDFVSNVSHELRTPLASLKALTETLQEGALEDPPAARRFLSQMDTEIDNLTQMVRELLELSKIESGRVPIQRKLVDSNRVIRKSVDRMYLQAERAGLTLEFQPENRELPVQIDEERVEQVIVNLIHNAIKFTPPGGSIQICNRVENGSIIISVHDSGVGIAPADLPRIFERFYKADRARSGGGTGLGLSIARHTVEAHGGRIWAESEPGKGSTFYLSLPAA